MLESLHLLSFIASPSAGESVRQPLALPVCWRNQHSSAVAAQQLSLQLAWKTGYTHTQTQSYTHSKEAD